MSAERKVTLKNGHAWYVGVEIIFDFDCPSRIQVIVPAEDLDRLSAEEIGQMIKECIPSAKLLGAEEMAESWDARGIGGIEGLEKLISDLEPYEKSSKLVGRELPKIRGYIQELKDKEARKKLYRAPKKTLRKQVIERDEGNCRYCGEPASKKPHIDHVVPYSLGGLTELNNLVVACSACNLRKSGHTLEQAGMVLLPA